MVPGSEHYSPLPLFGQGRVPNAIERLKKQVMALFKGKANLVDGKVPSSELPSYVDDVLEYDTRADFPTEGERGKIYVALDTNVTYRWSGSTYVVVGSAGDISGKADKVTGATAGNLAGLDADGNLTDSGAKPADFDAAGAASDAISAHLSDAGNLHVTSDEKTTWNGKQNAISAYLVSAKADDKSSTAKTTLTITPSSGSKDTVTLDVPKQDTSLAVSGAYADAKVTGAAIAAAKAVADAALPADSASVSGQTVTIKSASVTVPTVDATLATSGAAADAAATGAAIAAAKAVADAALPADSASVSGQTVTIKSASVTVPVVDATLATSGAAADAAATGAAIAAKADNIRTEKAYTLATAVSSTSSALIYYTDSIWEPSFVYIVVGGVKYTTAIDEDESYEKVYVAKDTLGLGAYVYIYQNGSVEVGGFGGSPQTATITTSAKQYISTAIQAASLTDAGLTAVFASTACSQHDSSIASTASGGSVTDLSLLFSSENTSLMETAYGKSATSAASLASGAVAVVDGSSGTAASPLTVEVSFAAASGDALRYCELLVTGVIADSAVKISLPSGTYQFGDDATTTSEGNNHFIFAEYSGGWFVSKEVTTESTTNSIN